MWHCACGCSRSDVRPFISIPPWLSHLITQTLCEEAHKKTWKTIMPKLLLHNESSPNICGNCCDYYVLFICNECVMAAWAESKENSRKDFCLQIVSRDRNDFWPLTMHPSFISANPLTFKTFAIPTFCKTITILPFSQRNCLCFICWIYIWLAPQLFALTISIWWINEWKC